MMTTLRVQRVMYFEVQSRSQRRTNPITRNQSQLRTVSEKDVARALARRNTDAVIGDNSASLGLDTELLRCELDDGMERGLLRNTHTDERKSHTHNIGMSEWSDR